VRYLYTVNPNMSPCIHLKTMLKQELNNLLSTRVTLELIAYNTPHNYTPYKYLSNAKSLLHK